MAWGDGVVLEVWAEEGILEAPVDAGALEAEVGQVGVRPCNPPTWIVQGLCRLPALSAITRRFITVASPSLPIPRAARARNSRLAGKCSA